MEWGGVGVVGGRDVRAYEEEYDYYDENYYDYYYEYDDDYYEYEYDY